MRRASRRVRALRQRRRFAGHRRRAWRFHRPRCFATRRYPLRWLWCGCDAPDRLPSARSRSTWCWCTRSGRRRAISPARSHPQQGRRDSRPGIGRRGRNPLWTGPEDSVLQAGESSESLPAPRPLAQASERTMHGTSRMFRTIWMQNSAKLWLDACRGQKEGCRRLACWCLLTNWISGPPPGGRAGSPR